MIGDDVVGQIQRLKRQVDGDIVVAGSAQLVRFLAEHDLIDEYRLMLFPVVLGSGKRLFADGTAHTAANYRRRSAAAAPHVVQP